MNQTLRYFSMPTRGLDVREKNCAMHSNVQECAEKTIRVIVKVFQGQPSMRKEGTKAQTPNPNIIGS
eukprot:scaffold32044_cov30-Tisochrysis_lutea.AAC.7